MSDRRVASSDEIIALGQTRPLDENDHLGIAKGIRKLYENREAFMAFDFSDAGQDIQKGKSFCLRGARFFLLGDKGPTRTPIASENAFAQFLGFAGAYDMAAFNNYYGYEPVIKRLDEVITQHSA